MTQITLPAAAGRTALLGFSDIVKIRNRVLELKQKGTKVIQLEGGEPFLPTPDFIKDAMKKALDENQTRYAPSSGIVPLIESIRAKLSAKNSIDVEKDQIIVTSGGMHGLFCAFQSTLNPGDETILFSPYWTPIRDLIRYCGGVSVRIPWDEVGAGDMHQTIASRITPRTKVIYVNSPANPTGKVLSRKQMEAIANVALEHNLTVIADEAYEDLVYDGSHVSMASLPDMLPRTITVFTLSKSYSMTGWRIGYVVADRTFMDVLRKIVLNSINGVSTPTQWAAAAAIADDSGYLKRVLPEYLSRRDLLVNGLNESGFACSPPAGAFYILVDARQRLGGDSWKAMEELLSRTGIATVPGVVFGPEGEGHLRMSYSNPMATIEAAIEGLRTL